MAKQGEGNLHRMKSTQRVTIPSLAITADRIGRDGLPGWIDLFTEEETTLVPHEPPDLPRPGKPATG